MNYVERWITVNTRTLYLIVEETHPYDRASKTPIHDTSSRVLDNENIPAEVPHLLLHDERLDVGHVEGGVEADGRVEVLEEDGVGG